MKVRALEERQTWPLGCVSGKWWWILLEPKASLSSFLSRCRLRRGSGRLCPHRPGHIWSHIWRGSCWRAGRKGPSLRTHTFGSLSPEAGPEGLLECRGPGRGPSGSHVAPGHPVSPLGQWSKCGGLFADEPSTRTASGPQPPSCFPASLLHQGSLPCPPASSGLASLESPWAEG